MNKSNWINQEEYPLETHDLPIREISNIIEPPLVIEGAGVRLRRSIVPQVSNEFDPFLLFDHFAFNDPREGTNPGFPMHPHRGIETVTYMLEGMVAHRDSLGNSGVIGIGDVQWMTSGGGIMHEEMPSYSQDGRINGFQLWINLPAALKMSKPRYQEIKATLIPVFMQDGVSVRVVAGKVRGIQGPATKIAIQPLYLEVNLVHGKTFVHSLPSGHTVLAYVFEGSAQFGSRKVDAVHMAIFGPGNLIHVQTVNSPVRFMLIAGEPIGEPISPYGPFVMNTKEEIQQALRDLHEGTFVKD